MSKLIPLIGFTVFSSMVLSGCSFLQPERLTPPELPLLAPTATMPSELLKQRLTLQAQEHKQSFITLVKITPEKTSLVTLTPSGQSFLSQSYDGQHWRTENLSGQTLPERDIFAMMQFSLWPEDQVQQTYQASPDWRVQISADKRQAYFHERLYMTVTHNISNGQASNAKASNDTVIENIPGQYRVEIHTFDKERLKP